MKIVWHFLTLNRESDNALPEGSFALDDSKTYCFYIVHPNFPEEFTTVITSHKSPITMIEWCPPSIGGGLLLTADSHEQVCLWKMEVTEIQTYILL
jgi:hypothetical protein